MSKRDEHTNDTKMQNSQTRDEQTKTDIYFEIEKSGGILGYKLEGIDYFLLMLFALISVIGYIAIDQKIDAICGYILPIYAMGITAFIFISYLWYIFKVLKNYVKNR